MFAQSGKLFFYLFIFLAILSSSFLFPHEDLSSYDQIYSKVHLELDWKGWLTICIFFMAFFALIKELFPPDVIMLSGAGFLVVVGIIEAKDFLRGFSQDIIVTLAMLFIIARALEMNGIHNILSRRAMPKSKNIVKQLFAMMLPLSVGSAFLNNTPLVLMFTPIVRKWSLERGLSPSKFLIPLSYATILGGSCTLIGNSCNLIVDGMLRSMNPSSGLGFFELAWIGVPATIVGFFYMFLIGHRLLPECLDATTAVSEQTREFTTEFLVTDGCVLCGKTIEESGRKYFQGENLVEIERGNILIDSPGTKEKICLGDRLVFAGDIETIAKLHGIEGLRSLADFHFRLDVTSSHFAEVVIATTSSLIGKTLRKVGFRRYYGASVLAVYRQGKRVAGNVGEIILQAGDTLMLLSGKPWEPRSMYNNDFYYIKYSEKLPMFHPVRGSLALLILFSMIAAVTMGFTMMNASLCAVLALFLTRNISIREARHSIRWNLLVLIASAFAFAFAMNSTGVAEYIAAGIMNIVGNNKYLLIAAIFTTTMLITEMITNNAAALLIFPIAMQIAHLGGFDSPQEMKAVAITVAIAASYAFATPIGYQTNTIVYGPGGYKFTDYVKVGLPLCLLLLILCVILIPSFWLF